MPFQRVGSIIHSRGKQGQEAIFYEAEAKSFIEGYLKQKTNTNRLYCESVKSASALVRAVSPATRQEVYLLEYSLKQALRQQLNYKLKKLTATQ